MLYVTTRVKQDTFTSSRALTENRGPAGGFFVPLRLPKLDEQQIRALAEKSFSQNVADVINVFFGSALDSWAVEFAIGRYPVKLVNISSREIVAETWHNPMWRFERLVKGVEKAIRQSDQVGDPSGDWLCVAARIAVLFGIFGELLCDGTVSIEQPMDIAVPVGDFSAVMSAWYAREMGLPISSIVICCNENGGVWKLLNKGEIRTGAVAVKTNTPGCDYAVPTDLERLIFSTLGPEETIRFGDACRRGGSYYLEPDQVKRLRKGIFVSVVSQRRLESNIPNMYAATGYIPDAYTALVCTGLIDYRSQTGEGKKTLILSEESPAFSQELICRCLNLTEKEFKKRLNEH